MLTSLTTRIKQAALTYRIHILSVCKLKKKYRKVEVLLLMIAIDMTMAQENIISEWTLKVDYIET
jgi:hypothetical protein